MKGIWLHNLRKWVTGTLTGGKYGLDVNVVNSTLPIAFSEGSLLEYRFQDFSDTAVNELTGNFVQVGDTDHPAADIANTITRAKFSNNSGGALVFAIGANAGAAAAASPIAVVAQGQTSEASFGVALVSGNKIWVRALQDTAIDSGQVLVTLFG